MNHTQINESPRASHICKIDLKPSTKHESDIWISSIRVALLTASLQCRWRIARTINNSTDVLGIQRSVWTTTRHLSLATRNTSSKPTHLCDTSNAKSTRTWDSLYSINNTDLTVSVFSSGADTLVIPPFQALTDIRVEGRSLSEYPHVALKNSPIRMVTSWTPNLGSVRLRRWPPIYWLAGDQRISADESIVVVVRLVFCYRPAVYSLVHFLPGISTGSEHALIANADELWLGTICWLFKDSLKFIN